MGRLSKIYLTKMYQSECLTEAVMLADEFVATLPCNRLITVFTSSYPCARDPRIRVYEVYVTYRP
jgi:hypothetical protein